MQQVKRDPAPSRWGYRYQRLMLTPTFRVLLRKGLPLLVVAAGVGLYFMDEGRRAKTSEAVADIRASIEERPEFMVSAMAIDGAGPMTSGDVRTVVPVDFPISSFDLDLEEMRLTIEALNAVEGAALRVRPGGILQVDIAERVPVAIWRTRDGLRMIDGSGVFVGPIDARSHRADLPLIAGDGAQDHIDEALELFAATGPISTRVRGLVRMGERRWDVVLDREQRLLLPTHGALEALERVIVLHEAQELLDRDVAVVDLRHKDRPTIRLNTQAAEALRTIKQTEFGDGN
ncbi:MAG: cell division protein FtsQ/DivIB [Paracoccaceae bacterium]|jgi:cell division protein FtsQ|nr:cell division protein FtsQ/DivIB [Paracoccaceae bacterium]MDG2453568.1 cell division protein FtsQ/DivIB [Paracoccaceae bacterium]